MKIKTIRFLFLIATFAVVFLDCAAKPVDLKKQNPKLFKELIKDYLIASEGDPEKVKLLRFIENETQSIVGKIDNFPIETCNWFFDRKIKTKNTQEDIWSISKTVNLNCGGQYYIIEFDKQILQASKLKYKGIYKSIFHQLKKAIILEASCSISSTSKKEEDERSNSVECYPYPYDLDRYAKAQKREVIAGYFLYTDSQETLERLMASSKEERENDKIILALKKDFINEETANNQKMNPSIGKNFSFKNCEYIDFREVQVENVKGKELKIRIDKLMESDLTDPVNKESLKDALEEQRNCGNRCISREKEIQIFFEIKNIEAKRKILLIKKIDSKSELYKYKRFSYYPLEGSLEGIDFSVKGEIEKIYLNPIVDEKNISPEPKSETKITPTNSNKPKLESDAKSSIEEKPKTDLDPKTNPTEEEKPKSKKGKKNHTTEATQPIPEPEINGGELEKK